MYRYYQKREETSWIPIPDGPDAEKRALEAGARKLTILAVSEIIDAEATDKSALSYKGPLYFDIDNPDLEQSIASAKQLVRKLLALDVPPEAVQVYASGSKGFHVLVPTSVFSSGRAQKHLPLVYKEIAVDLHVIGIDFQVYSEGRGNSFRIANVQRGDNRYRVAVSHETLEVLTPGSYLELTAQPGTFTHPETVQGRSPALESMMEAAKRKVRAKPSRAATPVPVSKLAQFQTTAPMCVQELAEYRVKKSANFNIAALQMATFISRSGMKEEAADSLMSRMASNATSGKYDTANARLGHLQGLVAYCNTAPDKHFACNAIRSVLQNRVCDDCPLNGSGASSGDAAYEIGVLEKPDGYYIDGQKGPVRISTFTIEPVAVYIEQGQNGGSDRRIGTLVEIMREGEVIGTVMFSETGWDSKAALKAEMRGINNLSFTGTEDDVQRIKHMVFHEGKDMGEVIQVHTAGMHTHKISRDREIFVYVEPNYSVNQLKISGTHILGGKVSAPPDIRHLALPPVGDKETTDALECLMQVNAPDVVAQTLGWFTACHLKAHFMRRYTQFPLLSLWGNSGAGKTATSSLFSWLNGVDYSGANDALNLSSVTKWAMIHYCSSTTTVPRQLEEYNKSKMRSHDYDFCGEVMKAAWNANMMGRGTISRSGANGRGRTGAEMVEISITSPLVIMSEQAPQMTALQQRSIQVMLTSDGKRGRAAYFNRASALRGKLAQMAKALVLQALTTPIDWVEQRMEETTELVPATFLERPRYSYQVLLTGLRFLEMACRDLKLPVSDQINALFDALVYSLAERAEEISRAKNRTEIDAVLEDMGVMASLTAGGRDWMVSGRHYLIKGDSLFLDAPVAHAMYRMFKKSTHEVAVIDNLGQFLKLITQEPYFLNDKAVLPEFVSTRPVVQLDVNKLVDKGLNISMWRGQ